MAYTFEQYVDLLEATSNIPEQVGGSEQVYVPGLGEVKDARELVPDSGPANVIHEAFVLYHRLVASQVVKAFDHLLDDMADGDPDGAVERLHIHLRDATAMANEWKLFTIEHVRTLSPGGC